MAAISTSWACRSRGFAGSCPRSAGPRNKKRAALLMPPSGNSR
jgi:hypothetical protein